MERMEKIRNDLKRIKAPIGENPPDDPKLNRRIDELIEKKAPLGKIFSAISEWESEAVREDREAENTKLTGRLDRRTVLRRL
jgi:hypothetical protein